MPAATYRWYFRAHSVKSLERNLLGTVGTTTSLTPSSLNASVYWPRACPSFLLLISYSPMSEFDHQLWSMFFEGNITLAGPVAAVLVVAALLGFDRSKA